MADRGEATGPDAAAAGRIADPGLAARRVLVTGGSGFLGTALCRALVEGGAEVDAVSRSVEPGDRDLVRWSRADLADPDAARELLARLGPELVFHLAGHAAAEHRVDEVLPTFRSNLSATVHLLAAAAELDCRRIVVIGSPEEPADDDSEVVPSSPYAAGKWAASAYARMFHALFGTPTVIARTFRAYGPGRQDPAALLPYVIRALLRGEAPRLPVGNRPIDWIYIDDVVAGLIRLATAPGVEGRTVDLGSGAPVTVRDLVAMLVERTGARVRPIFDALPGRTREQVRVADVDATARVIGWRPTTPLSTGLDRTIAWYAAIDAGVPA